MVSRYAHDLSYIIIQFLIQIKHKYFNIAQQYADENLKWLLQF